jgi:hypothetical protein
VKISTARNLIFGLYGFFFSLCAVFAVAWGTHVVVCIKNHEYLFMLVGAIAFPVAVVHGIGIWFGVW